MRTGSFAAGAAVASKVRKKAAFTRPKAETIIASYAGTPPICRVHNERVIAFARESELAGNVRQTG